MSEIYVVIGKIKAKNLMWDYLYENNYTQEQIETINVKHSFINRILSYPEWRIKVIYKNNYFHVYRMKNGKIYE
ncbi:hypothetical protein [Peptoniphilus sp. oral taxon 386]|uniref:hypothetical protein n=1 Tax=Peptoniphilus sp. oral taxon 386 TaxID=652713 RepID=UPI001C3F3EDE|nr:hypothetical protein [Peptoniphilus sp. oral taxon 386]